MRIKLSHNFFALDVTVTIGQRKQSCICEYRHESKLLLCVKPLFLNSTDNDSANTPAVVLSTASSITFKLYKASLGLNPSIKERRRWFFFKLFIFRKKIFLFLKNVWHYEVSLLPTVYAFFVEKFFGHKSKLLPKKEILPTYTLDSHNLNLLI